MKTIPPILLFVLSLATVTASQRYDLEQRASAIDPAAKEHPAIDFVFTDEKGKPADLQHASVDPRVPSRGRLEIGRASYRERVY